MKLKTYQAWTMAEALAFVKTDLGVDAVIVHTRTFERGGFFGIGRRAVVAITAARAVDMPKTDNRGDAKSAKAMPATARASSGNGIEQVRLSAAARAYGAPIAVNPNANANAFTPALTPSLDMEVEREKTRRLAQAMAIQLEKQASVRAASEANARATSASARMNIAATNASPAFPSTSVVATTTPAGPAQRFVLVPEPRTVGSLHGTHRLSAAVVRETGAVDERHALLGQDRIEAVAFVAPVVAPRVVNELDTISAFVGRVLGREASHGAVSPVTSAAVISSAARDLIARVEPLERSCTLEAAYARLIEQEVAKELADRIMRDVTQELASSTDEGIEPSELRVREAIERRISALLPSDELDSFRMLPGKHGARRIAFVGPTGVGKTTTLAKIAAQLTLKRGLRVGIVAADTYRIAAVDQLRTYAEILGVNVEVASSPTEAARACERLGDVDVILIDTAGRSQNDRMKLSELRAFLAAAQPDETHLVLSATASARALAREAEAFGPLGVDRLVLTKLDEAASFGTLISLVERLGTRVSFFTHGQEVPDHIEVARGGRLAALVMGNSTSSHIQASEVR